MADHAPPAGPPLPGAGRGPTASEERRARLLTVTRRRAGGLLVAVTVVFAVSTALVSQHHWLGWVQATAVASMVGGLADWFAVTALFRRPLGLPIPHTAIVVERKDRFASTIGAFVQESFLTPEAVINRVRATAALERAARWLSSEDNAAELAGRAAEALASAAGLLRDSDVHDVIYSLARQRLDSVALAPLAGRALERLTLDGRHEPVLDAGFDALGRYLHDNGAELHDRLGAQSPWWLPGVISSRMVHRLLDRSETVLADMAADRRHPIRQQLEAAIGKLAVQLQSDPWMRQRGEELKAELLAQPTVRELVASIWSEAKDTLREQSGIEGSHLRVRLAGAVEQAGRRLAGDPVLAATVERSVEELVRVVLTSFESELESLVSGTIARWDAQETSRRLELLLGPDLQYIRINGTVVGAAAGLALHAVTVAVH